NVARTHEAFALAYLGRMREARQVIDPVLETDPGLKHWSIAGARYVQGVIERLEGRPETALELQRTMLAGMSEPTERLAQLPVLTEIGLNQIELGALEGASASLQRALALSGEMPMQQNPLRADALVALARVRLAQ